MAKGGEKLRGFHHDRRAVRLGQLNDGLSVGEQVVLRQQPDENDRPGLGLEQLCVAVRDERPDDIILRRRRLDYFLGRKSCTHHYHSADTTDTKI